MSGLNGTDLKLFDYYPRLKRPRQYVEQSYSGPIPLEKAAGIAALESTYFSSIIINSFPSRIFEFYRCHLCVLLKRPFECS